MTKIQEELFNLRDEKYADFISRLTPSVNKEYFIGVRVPNIKGIVKTFINDPKCEEFLNELPHKYYEENMLHSFLISNIKDYDKCISELDKFLPYVDNWATCDSLKIKDNKKHREELIIKAKEWVKSEHEYTSRFGLEVIMNYFLEEDFKKEYLDLAAKTIRDEYYIKIMVAWFFSVALVKQWDATLPYIENKVMPKWEHNKSIQKAIESSRIDDKRKDYLRGLRIK